MVMKHLDRSSINKDITTVLPVVAMVTIIHNKGQIMNNSMRIMTEENPKHSIQILGHHMFIFFHG